MLFYNFSPVIIVVFPLRHTFFTPANPAEVSSLI
jgi:hypothetical protein